MSGDGGPMFREFVMREPLPLSKFQRWSIAAAA